MRWWSAIARLTEKKGKLLYFAPERCMQDYLYSSKSLNIETSNYVTTERAVAAFSPTKGSAPFGKRSGWSPS